MSAPSADNARPAGAGVILGIAFGLMVCAGLVVWLYLSRGGAIDGAAELESAFGVRVLGARYTITDAREMPSGARIVVLDDLAAPAEAPAPETRDEGDERTEWRKVVIPDASSSPRRIVFTFPKPENGQAAVDAFFRPGEAQDIADLPKQGGKVVVKSDKIAWRSYGARWVHERAFEPPLTFRDALRVDLSLPQRPCVMTALWSRGEAASRSELETLLAQLGSG